MPFCLQATKEKAPGNYPKALQINRFSAERITAEATIDRILAEVAAFKGEAPQSDDMTCVVLRVEEANV